MCALCAGTFQSSDDIWCVLLQLPLRAMPVRSHLADTPCSRPPGCNVRWACTSIVGANHCLCINFVSATLYIMFMICLSSEVMFSSMLPGIGNVSLVVVLW
jgi:hypothetical protein